MKGGSLAILRSLLSEADFFVDGKDLQTFVGATSQSRFFLPGRSARYDVYERRLRWRLPAGAASSASIGGGVLVQSSIT
ncbi:hypothetical protein BCCR75502_00916 [Burkholderia sola]|nr:hypothetical protein BCCR75389_00904 [Burkholderia cenocepacia]CAG2263923.1 hypothetical protein BCCR75386_00917 [Burkholderia cenocepacia]CAG2264041.1 hypothetical protein BCCR75388_00918 [Burkholderia cenocepacia]CAG2264116.1 hypothetical protein BCCR75384_00918 [Burkholderia cenocepacia]CAG2264121.1 hypothetical protein BCCR75387_00918 [Burkholderia cenocepacia]